MPLPQTEGTVVVVVVGTVVVVLAIVVVVVGGIMPASDTRFRLRRMLFATKRPSSSADVPAEKRAFGAQRSAATFERRDALTRVPATKTSMSSALVPGAGPNSTALLSVITPVTFSVDGPWKWIFAARDACRLQIVVSPERTSDAFGPEPPSTLTSP